MDKGSLDRFRKSLRSDVTPYTSALVSANNQGRGQNPAEVEERDEGDLANASTANEMSVIQQTQAENLLKAINGALDQIDAGTFGRCRNCGREIGVKRLEAIPWTRYCITCQEVIDNR
jgi:DnaK suppressor protein